jgi:hypothetical protein
MQVNPLYQYWLRRSKPSLLEPEQKADLDQLKESFAKLSRRLVGNGQLTLSTKELEAVFSDELNPATAREAMKVIDYQLQRDQSRSWDELDNASQWLLIDNGFHSL